MRSSHTLEREFCQCLEAPATVRVAQPHRHKVRSGQWRLSQLCRLKLDTYSKSKYGSVITQNGGWKWFQSLLLVLQSIAAKHDASIANVASRWVLDKPAVAGIIVGARNANHVQDHVKLASLKLDDEDLGRIDEVLATGKQAQGDCYDWERGGAW